MSGLSTAAKKAREWTLKRDSTIREASAAGMSNRAIATLTGLSHTAIANIVARPLSDAPKEQ